MDYILNRIQNKIERLQSLNKTREIALYYQVRVEYILTLNIAYLWNKNLRKLNSKDKKRVIAQISRPTVGTLLSLCKTLDIENEISLSSRAFQTIQTYADVRNKSLGHGYTFVDKIEDYSEELLEIYNSFFAVKGNKENIISKNIDIISVTNFADGKYGGTKYSVDGMPYPWLCSKSVCDFHLNNLYITDESDNYYRISPFIIISEDDDIFLYSSIQEELLGRAKYNQLFKTDQCYHEWTELKNLSTKLTDSKSVSANGTIFNHFEKNYTEYIPLKIKSNIKHFLLKNQSSVCATVWGHGGVGKTSTVQSICEDLRVGDKKFDYIIFLSAKDRRFNFETGQIENISSDERIENLESIIQNTNKIIFDPESNTVEDLINFSGKMLLIIDDFETFSTEEKNKVKEFITQLNINNHKVLITTRANILTGERITTNELSEEETLEFLLEVAKVEFPDINLEKLQNAVNKGDKLSKIYEITSGRPLFIFQFVHLYARNQDSVDRLLQKNIKGSPSAINFLYERLFQYLSVPAQKLFAVLGKLIINSEDLSHLLSKAKYVLNMEEQEDEFNESIEELVKLKIIEVKEGTDIFQIYSKEIWNIMLKYYETFEDDLKLKWVERLNIVGHKKYSVDQSLLETANKLALSGDEEEVVKSYKEILDRTICPDILKVEAIGRLSKYYYEDIKKIDKALNLLSEKLPLYNEDGDFLKLYVEYNWLSGKFTNRKQSVSALLTYFQDRRSLQEPINLELYSLLVSYRAKLAITRMSELEAAKNSLSNIEYAESKQAILKIINDIYQIDGKRLFRNVQKINFYDSYISSELRSKIVGSLMDYVEISQYLERFKTATDICIFTFENFSQNDHYPFLAKFKNLYEEQDKSRHTAHRFYEKIILKKNEVSIVNFGDEKIPQVGGIRVKKLSNLREIERPQK